VSQGGRETQSVLLSESCATLRWTETHHVPPLRELKRVSLAQERCERGVLSLFSTNARIGEWVILHVLAVSPSPRLWSTAPTHGFVSRYKLQQNAQKQIRGRGEL
jgi:hypothetical protein